MKRVTCALPAEVKRVTTSALPTEVKRVTSALPAEVKRVTTSALPMELIRVTCALPAEVKRVTSALPAEVKRVTCALPTEVKRVTCALPSEVKIKSDLFLGLFHLSVAELSSGRSLLGRVKHFAFLRSISGAHPFMFGLQIQCDHRFCTIICLVVGVFVFCVCFKRENVTESGRPSDKDRDTHRERRER